MLATVYQLVAVAALFLGIAAVLRHRLAAMTSLISAFVTTIGVAVFLYPESTVLVAFAWASVPLLQHDPRRSAVFITSMCWAPPQGFSCWSRSTRASRSWLSRWPYRYCTIGEMSCAVAPRWPRSRRRSSSGG